MERHTSIFAALGVAAAVASSGLVIGLTGALPTQAQIPAGFSFGLIGDLGYSPRWEASFENVMADLNRDASLSFVVHVGDLSTVRYACTNDLQARRLAQFQAS